MKRNAYAWENFAEMLSQGQVSFDIPGPLHHPIESFKISRNKSLEIELHTTSHPKAPCKRIDHPPGTIRTNIEFAEISAPGLRARLTGVEPISWSDKYSASDRRGTLYEKSTVQEVIINAEVDTPPWYTIEWLANVDKHYMWPDSFQSEIETNTNEIFKSETLEIRRKSSSNDKSFGRSCVHLKVGQHDLFLGSADEINNNKHIMPGFILYMGTPNYDIRTKIRTALSFVYGRPFIFLGDSQFDQEWGFLASKSITPYSMDGKFLSLHTLPPAPLWKEWVNELNPQVFEASVNAFFTSIDLYDLEHISWLYWHAVAAPVHIGALSFGATFEAIQKAYIDAKPEKFKKIILEPAVWKGIKRKLVKIIQEEMPKAVSATPENKNAPNIIINRIQNINNLSASDCAELFLTIMNITLSEKEKIAWKQRNKAAHGGKTVHDDFISMIKETKILRLLCNLVLLSMTNCSDKYIDYHTLNFPIKSLYQPIE